MSEPAVAFGSGEREIRINFGVFAGREATAAEIGELARELGAKLERFALVSERRSEFADGGEASVHQVRIEVEEPLDDELRGRLLEIADRWTQACIDDRHAEVADL